MSNLLTKLQGGDRRSKGRSQAVVADVLATPSLFGAVVHGALHEDPLIRIRAADAVEKVTSKHPDWLKRYKRRMPRYRGHPR